MFVAAAKMWWRFSTVTLRLVTILAARPTHLHGCHHHPACKVIQCLGNGLDQHGNQVLLLVRTSLLLTWHCHLWSACWELPALVGDVDEELGTSLPVLASGYLSVRRFSSVQQFARLTTISYPASICVSCHHNGRQGPALWAVCQLVLGSWETPRYVSSWTNIVNIVFSSSINAWCWYQSCCYYVKHWWHEYSCGWQ